MADGEKRIKELEEITALTSNDYFVVDSSASGGKTKKYKATNITDIIDNIPELVAEFEPNHYYDRDALVAHEGKVYYHNAPGASYEEFPTGYQFIQIDLTGLLSRLGFGISIQHNSSFTYNKGDYCMEDYILYRCLNDNVTGAWSSSDWERASLGYDLSNIYKPRLDEHDEQIEEALALGTASGSIASFTDGSTLPMRKLEVDIEPVQDLHGYDNPWVGGSGKNKLNPDKVTKTSATMWKWYVSDGFLLKANTKYTLSNFTPNTNIQMYIMDSTGSTVLSSSNNLTSYTPTEDTAVIFQAYKSDNIPDSAIFQLEIGDKTAYEPYSNICPISGWDECKVSVVGKNWIADTIINGQIGSNGGYTSASNRITNSPSTTPYVSNSLLKKGTYTLSASGLDNCTVLTKDAENNIVDNYATSWHDLPYTFTITKDAYVLFTCRKSNNADISPSDYHPQIEVGEESSTYTPYNTDSHTYTIDLDGTRYGGTLDVVSGVLTVDRVIKTLNGSESWNYYSSADAFYLEDVLEYVSSDFVTSETNNVCLCNMYKEMNSVANSTFLLNRPTGTFCGQTGAFYKRIWIKDTRYTTAEAFETMLSSNNLQIVYPLATPQTIQLTPTEVKSLLATNNVFADTGDILDATYVRNANITINDLIRRIETLENA